MAGAHVEHREQPPAFRADRLARRERDQRVNARLRRGICTRADMHPGRTAVREDAQARGIL